MYELKKMERYLRVNLLGPGPRLVKKEFTGPRIHKYWETLHWMILKFSHNQSTLRNVPGGGYHIVSYNTAVQTTYARTIQPAKQPVLRAAINLVGEFPDDESGHQRNMSQYGLIVRELQNN